MSEEKKEEKIEAVPAQKPPELSEVKPQTAPEAAPTAAPAAATPAVPKAEDAKKEPVAVPKEKPANCAACNKSIKKKRWYYRNGKFYCSKRCWTTAVKKEAKPDESQGPKK